jgi:hypothetical protein
MITVTERLGQVEWEATGDTTTEAMEAFWQLRHGVKPQAGPAPTPPVVEIPDFALKACADALVTGYNGNLSLVGYVIPLVPGALEVGLKDVRQRIYEHLKAAFGSQEAENA